AGPHSCRDCRLRRLRPRQGMEGRPRAGAVPRRRQGIRRPGWRRDAVQVQHVRMVNDMRTYYLSACLIFAAACGDKATDTPTTYALTTQSIAELQAITTDTGTLICTADGYSACPLNQPVANRLSDGRILLWQPGGTVMLVTSGDSGFVLIGSDSTERPYLSVVAATTSGRDRIRMIDFAGVWRSLTVSLDGSLQSADTLAEPGV